MFLKWEIQVWSLEGRCSQEDTYYKHHRENHNNDDVEQKWKGESYNNPKKYRDHLKSESNEKNNFWINRGQLLHTFAGVEKSFLRIGNIIILSGDSNS